MPYQVNYQNARLEELIRQRKQAKFEGEIEDDIVLRLIGNF